jgi:hypothetical protein
MLQIVKVNLLIRFFFGENLKNCLDFYMIF